MNRQKLLEIANKAGISLCECGCNMPTRQTVKFAELLIQECLNISDEVCESSNNPEWLILERFNMNHDWRNSNE